MTINKTQDITYPNATAGVVMNQDGDEIKTMEQLVAHVGGTKETTRTVRPTKTEYGYVPVARD